MYRALYDFAAQESGELSIRTGEMLNKVPQEEEIADGWMLVQSLETGGEGYVLAHPTGDIKFVNRAGFSAANRAVQR